MSLINKQTNVSDSISNLIEPFPLILTTEILKHCQDYKILKKIQSISARINDLFTCPSQSVWKQLCHRNKFKYLLEKETRSFIRKNKMIWETIYYQNWRVEMNWIKKDYERIRIQFTSLNGRLVKMINGGTVLGLSLTVDSTDSHIKILDLKRGCSEIRSRRVSGQITSSCLQGGILILGKSCGSMTITKLSETTEMTLKLHSKEITSIIMYNDFIISGDIGGQIIKSKQNYQSVLYQSDSGITGLHRNGKEILATTINGILIIISIKKDDKISIKKFDFGEFGSINCIFCTDEMIILGTDTGKVNILNQSKSLQTSKLLRNSPITSIASNSKRIISGHFDGTITIYTIETGNVFVEDSGGKMAPIWSVGIDEISFISSSLNGEIILRSFL